LVAGMFIGTLFTLFILPTIYLLIAEKREARQPEGSVAMIANEPFAQPVPEAVAKTA